MSQLIGWVPVFVAAIGLFGIVVSLVVPRVWPLPPQKTEVKVIIAHEHSTTVTLTDSHSTKPNTTHHR